MPNFSFWKEIGKPAVQGLATVGLIGLGLAGADAIVDALENMKAEKKTKKYYQDMLDMHPQLKEMDPELVARHWNTLNHYAPYIAQDPLSAGAYLVQSINRMSGNDIVGPTPDILHTLVEVERKANPVDKDDKTIRGYIKDKAIGNAIEMSYKTMHRGTGNLLGMTKPKKHTP